MSTTSKFKELLAKTEKLTELENGKLKGGIAVLSVNQGTEGFNLICYINIRRCKILDKKPTEPIEPVVPAEPIKPVVPQPQPRP